MNQNQVSNVWLAVCAFCFYYALDSWIVGQGGSALFGSDLIVKGKAPIAMTALPIVSAVSLLGSLVGCLHSHRSGSAEWARRMPLVGFASLDLGDWAARCFQAAILFSLSVLPLFSLIYFWSVFLNAKFVSTDGSGRLLSSVWDFSEAGFNDPARICSFYNMSGEKPGECLTSATVFPGWEPALFGILTAAALVAAAAFWWSVFRLKPQSRPN